MAIKHFGAKHFSAKSLLTLSHALVAAAPEVVVPVIISAPFAAGGGTGPATPEQDAALDAALLAAGLADCLAECRVYSTPRIHPIQRPATTKKQKRVVLEIEERVPVQMVILDQHRELLRVAGTENVIYPTPSGFAKGAVVATVVAAAAFLLWQHHQKP